MFFSSVCLFLAHFLWLYFGGVRSWLAVYLSSFSQPTHFPFSIYFGYFFGIHSGILLLDSTTTGDDGKITFKTDEEVGRSGGSGDVLSKDNKNNTTSADSSGDISLTKLTPGSKVKPLASLSPSTSPTPNSTCQVTVSNYSWLMRLITFDQSLHCEHHDFPKIPCHLLGRLRHIAPEFYGHKQVEGGQGTATAAAATIPPAVQCYHYFFSPWIRFLYASPSQYASCVNSLE
jgi:hypothetical protein